MPNLITLEQYAMGRDIHYPEEWALVKPTAILFLEQINGFLLEAFPNFPNKKHVVASGWRPKSINDITHGASKLSTHITGEGLDLKDYDQWYKSNLRPDLNFEMAELLRNWGLFLEDPTATPRWCHLDKKDRVDRDDRIFKIK